MPNPIEAYGVFEGGGVKGIALVGALKAAEERGIKFRAVAGTSAGAIVSSLHAAGYTVEQLRDILYGTNFRSFMDPVVEGVTSWVPGANFAKAWSAMGLYKGDVFHSWIREKLSKKILGIPGGNPCFRDLIQQGGKPLAVVATEVTSQRIRDFRNGRHDDMNIADAVRMSMSIPFFFKPYQYGSQLYVDGGVLSNFPAWVFESESVTTQPPIPIIGFRFEPEPPGPIENIWELGMALVGTIQKEGVRLLNAGTSNVFTVELPTAGVSTTDFDLSDDDKKRLFDYGYYSAKARLSELT
jgi:NTE family protein